jgi:uncharacterized protein (TIGR00369 family)
MANNQPENQPLNSDDIFRGMANSGLKIPPPIFEFLGGEILEVTDKSMTTRYPVRPEYQNPFGYMQGGVLAAIIDNTIGPLSFLIAPPSVTTHFNISYVRPVGEDQQFVTVTGKLTHQTKRQLFMEAEVVNEAGKVVCFAHAIHNIL